MPTVIGSAELHQGDCLEVLKTLPANSVDSIITDPPYGLTSGENAKGGFMGKEWDKGIPGIAFWQEMFRVAKPGAMLLSFGGTRTHHRLMCAIEDAGWEIRDCLIWLYGSGFPKSMDISKQLDKSAGAIREVVGQREDILQKQAADIKRGTRKILDSFNAGAPERNNGFKTISADITAPSTDAAKEWNGWGTALKPAFEPIVLAMKPCEGTFAQNAEKWGVAGLNIDGCRIQNKTGSEQADRGREGEASAERRYTDKGGTNFAMKPGPRGGDAKGRFPANVLLGDEEVENMLDEQSGITKSTGGQSNNALRADQEIYGKGKDKVEKKDPGFGDEGGASRFFYCAKASKSERGAGIDNLYFLNSGLSSEIIEEIKKYLL